MGEERSPETRAIESEGYQKLLRSKGKETSRALDKLLAAVGSGGLFELTPDFYRILHITLEKWDDENAAKIIALLSALPSDNAIDEGFLTSIQMWLRSHTNDPSAVEHCLSVRPPMGMTVLKLLSLAGSQKLVFLANWQDQQRQVVLKRIIGQDTSILSRESKSHPFEIRHPNIIETHTLPNDQGEIFLVERLLPEVLNDKYPYDGIDGVANLLRDIASALSVIHERDLVHGDIKPDNIGLEDGYYILLDFGVCRPKGEVDLEEPTGSLRTRAPELLLKEASQSFRSDVWALGATVFHLITGRFPLYKEDEPVPRVSNPAERDPFINELSKRVENAYDEYVNLDKIPESMRAILKKMLDRHPDARPDATEIVKLAENELAAFLRSRVGTSRLTPTDELRQLISFLPEKEVLDLMPATQRDSLQQRLKLLMNSRNSLEMKLKEGLEAIHKRIS